MEMCKRCRRICEDERIKTLEREIQKDMARLGMLEALCEQTRNLENALKRSVEGYNLPK